MKDRTENTEGYNTYGIEPFFLKEREYVSATSISKGGGRKEDGYDQEGEDGRRSRTNHASTAVWEMGGVRGIM